MPTYTRCSMKGRTASSAPSGLRIPSHWLLLAHAFNFGGAERKEKILCRNCKSIKDTDIFHFNSLYLLEAISHNVFVWLLQFQSIRLYPSAAWQPSTQTPSPWGRASLTRGRRRKVEQVSVYSLLHATLLHPRVQRLHCLLVHVAWGGDEMTVRDRLRAKRRLD